MATTRTTIHIQDSRALQSDSVIMLGEAAVKKLRVPANQTIQIRCGGNREQAQVIPIPKSTGLRIGSPLAGKLGLVQGSRVNLAYRGGVLSMGPLIGVMISKISPQAASPFGALSSFCKEMTDACQMIGGQVFFFSPKEIQAGNHHVDGYTYYGGRSKRKFPIPDVVYNRLAVRSLENKPSVQQFFKDVKYRYSSHVFNERYMDKNEVFQTLRSNASVGRHLPESHPLKNQSTLKYMCGKYPTVFVKPTEGSLGRGIIRIARQSSGGYVCRVSSVNGATRQSFSGLSGVYASLSGKMKLRKYQIQQGLQLITAGGRPIDFRAVVQKITPGQWKITSIVARIAGNSSFVSNLARGGTLSTVKDALAKAGMGGSAASVQSRLRKAALDIASALESGTPGHFAEFGIDLAVDNSGHVWLLEVNSKPAKATETPTPDKIRPSVKRVVQYSGSLAGF